MDDLARAEYPGMLAHLQPGQAVQTLNERVKRINKINLEIADWLQVPRLASISHDAPRPSLIEPSRSPIV
ncbi:hypothetical protein CDD83_3601 [Cordyceps sp. RAO-2017]|nr:hypothetical protein CDD83_3601 [Cordyceps sp. RAO-2017]